MPTALPQARRNPLDLADVLKSAPTIREVEVSMDSLQAPPGIQTQPGWVELLKSPRAYPPHWHVDEVVVIQTHASVVFLAGDYALKVKKAVDFGFLDYSTLERRLSCCAAEVEKNRRLAPEIYLGVVAIARDGDGWRFACERAYQPSNLALAADDVEVAVWMRRMQESQNLAHMLTSASLADDEPHADALGLIIGQVAQKMAHLHEASPAPREMLVYAAYSEVERSCSENLQDLARGLAHVNLDVQQIVGRIAELQRNELARLQPIIASRCREGVVTEIHGDLRLEHIYVGDWHGCPLELSIVDCVEFNPRFQYNDPIADVSFLVMDLVHLGRSHLAAEFIARYLACREDPQGNELVRIYATYRTLVRAKVELLRLLDPKLDGRSREAARQLVVSHLHLACVFLDDPAPIGGIVLVAGLPGSGKSTLSRLLTQTRGYSWLRSDELRKELQGLHALERASASFGEGIYDASTTKQTYEQLLARGLDLAITGKTVLLDASWSDLRARHDAIALARKWGVGISILVCEAPESVCLTRLRNRRGDASDADPAVYAAMRAVYAPLHGEEERYVVRIDTGGDAQAALTKVPHRLLTPTLEFAR